MAKRIGGELKSNFDRLGDRIAHSRPLQFVEVLMTTKRSFASGVLVSLIVLLTLAGTVTAQEAILPYREYAKRTDAAQRVGPLTDAAFGAETSLYNGSTSFRVVDIDLPGTGSVPVRLSRRMDVAVRPSSATGNLPGMADWQIEVPMIEGTFTAINNWTVGSGSAARCSSGMEPRVSNTFVFVLEDIWHGHSMHIPGQGSTTLLVNDKSGVPQPSDGATYPWITSSGFRIKCLPTITGGTGEGFLAVAPDGTKYWFDQMVIRQTSSVTKPGITDPRFATMHRNRVYLLATRVEDRHGNWVTYSYANGALQQINAKDGRNITLTWSGPGVTSATAAGKTWQYQYKPGTGSPWTTGPGLQKVILPDGSAWQYIATGALTQAEMYQPSFEGGTYTCPNFHGPEYAFEYVVRHPAGAAATFSFLGMRHFRSSVPWICQNYPDSGYEELAVPNYADVASLVSKTVSGPGMVSKTWTYAYGEPNTSSFSYPPMTPGGAWFIPTPRDACEPGVPCAPEPHAKYVTQTESTGRVTRFTFGTGLDVNEGRLLATEVLSGSTVLRRVANVYVTDAEAASLGFAPEIGTNRVPGQPLSTKTRPVREQVTTLDGTQFESYTLNYDAHARPTRVRERSRIAGVDQHSRVQLLAYYDHLPSWTVGQLQSKEIEGGGSKTFELSFHASSTLPATLSKHGLLVESYTYGADGNLATVKDGLNQTTTLGDWYRGVPRAVGFPDGTSVSATLDASGNITSVTNELGFTTSYAYDAGGRVSQITHPSGDTVAWAPTTISMVPVLANEYGIFGGHWRQTVSTGNARRITYFDGLWRPRLVHEYDTTNVAGTQRFTVQDYDADGRASFSAYPVSSLTTVADASQGTWTLYDLLDRPTSVSQDSEHGLLTTTTEYLSGFRQRVTNPRGHATTITYQAFDQPDTGAPVLIEAPAGQTTAIARTLRGEPISLTRSGTWSGGSQSLTRSYVYDAHRRLCKTLEPETGATVMGYDAASNLTWTAAGLALPGTSDASCGPDRTAAYSSGRRVDRTYDARHRLMTLAFPDGNGNQTWTYTADGLPASITTLNSYGTSSVVNSYSYNKRRLMTAEAVDMPGWYNWTLQYAYNANGHLSAQTYPSGLVVGYAPNALGQATQAGSYATGVQYHPNGAIKQFTYGNGLVHTMVQNARLLPARSTDTGGALDHEYGYDGNGNVVATIDHNDSARSRWMAYDPLDRLTDANAAMFGGDHWHRFTYDALDNLRSWKLAGVKDYANYVYDASNRLTAIQNTGGSTLHTLSYDVQGNVTAKDTASYTFDYGNRLRLGTGPGGSEGYRYDGHGRRALAWVPAGATLSFYAFNGQLLYQHSTPKARALDHIYLAGSLVAIREAPFAGGSEVKYQHTDALGSPVAISNAAGTVTERTNYDPYGGAINKTVDGVGYTGHVMDPVTGLTYMQQRYYDPGMGVFLSVDPVTTNHHNGESFNRYRYGNNSPYKFIDPDGRDACSLTRGPSCDKYGGFDSRPRGGQCEKVCIGGPTSRPANGPNRHAKRDRQVQEAIRKFSPDTFGADVEYDPHLNAAGSNIGAHKIVLGPRAFHFSLGFLASVIQHEAIHVRQDQERRSFNYGRGSIDNEVEATVNQLRNAGRFNLTPQEIQAIRKHHEARYGPLPSE